MRLSQISLFFVGALAVNAAFPAATPIALAHRLEETQAEKFALLVEKFNKKQNNVEITLVRRAENDPARPLNLVTREEYERFLAKKARFTPLSEVMKAAKMPLNGALLSPELKDADGKSNLFSLPIAFSTPVLYYNKTAFQKAGLNPDLPPKTWDEMHDAASKLIVSGITCVYTTSWPAWILVDNFNAWHGTPVSSGRAAYNFNHLLQIKHIAMLTTWVKGRYFSYFGRRDEADHRFAAGECGMLTSGSSQMAIFAEQKNFEVGVTALPFHADEIKNSANTLADGASLWVSAGLKPAETKAVAQFVTFLVEPQTQLELTVENSFLPLTPVARAAAESRLLKAETASLKVAFAELRGRTSNPALRIAQNERARLVVEEELEAVWAGKKPAKQALDDAVQRANVLLKAPVKAAKPKK